MFDINTLAAKETTELQLRHPATDEPLFADEAKTKPVAIVIYGTSSKKYRDAVSAMQNRQLKRGKKTVSAEVMREEGVELLVACSDKAINLALDGQPVDNAEAFRKLYTDPSYGWLKDQVDSALAEVSNFLKV